MTLEDFFTLTEMKDGLTATARVKELVTVMLKDKDIVIKNVGDTTRQWSTVASSIAATENKDCLDLFIQLDGLWFINRWLKEAQKFGNDTEDRFVEESIMALLRALEKLDIDSKKSISSGIWTTVENLLGHGSCRVQDRARALFNRWKQDRDSDSVPQDIEKVEACRDGRTILADRVEENGCSEISLCSGGNEENNVEPERLDDAQIQKSEKTLDHAIIKGGTPDHVEPVTDNLAANEHSLVDSLEVRKEGAVQGKLCSELGERTDDVKQKLKASPSENTTISSSAEVSKAPDCAMVPDLKEVVDAKDEDLRPVDSPLANLRTDVCEGKSGMDDEAASEVEEDSGNDSDYYRPAVSANDPGVVNKRSDTDNDYSMVDPLEVARQVAIEVEREVDCREPSCSSSEKILDGGTRQPNSPDSTNGRENQPIEVLLEEASTGPNLTVKASPVEEPFGGAENQAAERGNIMTNELESSQVTEAAQEPEANANRGFCGFDLNEEVCSEELDCTMNSMSTPISVVSASRAAAATELPAAPLQFEGTLGWKGSAATSAFRPASPRRIPEVDKTSSSKQRQDYLDIDLNVAEVVDDKIADLMSGRQIPTSSGLPSRESSVEASPRRSDRLDLDLNLVGDGGDAPSDWRIERRLFRHGNGHQSPSPSSSSSSMHPSLRNFDLNDQPSSLDHLYLGKSSQNLYASGGRRPEDCVISIMGARVGVRQNDIVPQTLPILNGRFSDPAVDATSARLGGILGMGSAMPYAHSPVYGYNGLTPGPTLPFTPTMYVPGGPMSYMVDARGAPVGPQILGPASAFPPPFAQPPFIMSMSDALSGSNGAGPSRHNFDLNAGLMMEGGNREAASLRQLFNPGQQVISLDDHMRANSQPSSSSGGGRRKEPDGGWEPYQSNVKRLHPPWN
ncbi:hypothetical protein RJ639_016750 [Escallonia herrerae]|uniref:TFIIS N-terminal domain-containing protein n=1 Tax=Escallonia herrerae TaxID=1293975 RepID=A0AA89AKI8_9ASTE|nr:hypothetical protein RJ639_019939 [Escallonia herrerae]KAK3007334.1 hypothetical protein RJ639_016750 [Escallonia herrerae]